MALEARLNLCMLRESYSSIILEKLLHILRYALPHRLVTREKLAQGRKEELGGEVAHHGM